MPAPDYATEIASLEAGLGSGIVSLTSEGESITYRGASDILAAISYFKGLAAQAAASGAQSTLAAFEWD
jgi:hypothetical protein